MPCHTWMVYDGMGITISDYSRTSRNRNVESKEMRIDRSEIHFAFPRHADTNGTTN